MIPTTNPSRDPQTPLAEVYDAFLFDLDGVVYRGPAAVPEAAETLASLRAAGRRVGFVTNNASRTPEAVAEHLVRLGIHAEPSDVVTSAQAIAAVMAAELSPGTEVFVLGTDALARELTSVGLTPVQHTDSEPDVVVQGYDPQLTWPRLQHACKLLGRDAAWYASNNDLTIPSDDGIMPGLGSVINLLAGVVGRYPRVAGKPETPLLEQTVRRIGGSASLFVGDRLDTDIAGARRVGMASLFVLSGVHTLNDLRDAPPEQRPDFLGRDLSALTLTPVADEPDHVAEDTELFWTGPDDAAPLTIAWSLVRKHWDTGRAVRESSWELALR